MKLRLQRFIENKLSKAHYEFDESVGQWAGWIDSVSGVYAQGGSIESVRNELAEILEERVLMSMWEQKKVKGLPLNYKSKTKFYA